LRENPVVNLLVILPGLIFPVILPGLLFPLSLCKEALCAGFLLRFLTVLSIIDRFIRKMKDENVPTF